MRFFSSITSSCFSTDPDGTRLFFPWGVWARPYIVPDAVIEQRLGSKTLWMLAVCCGAFSLSALFLLRYVPQMLEDPAWTIAFLALFVAASRIVGHFMLRSTVRGLRRAERPLGLRTYYLKLAMKSSTLQLICLVFFSVAFATASVWSVIGLVPPIIAVVNAGFFGFCGVAGAYTLFLKYRTKGRDGVGRPPAG